MSCKWTTQKLGDLCDEITVGFVGSMTKEYVDKGIPFFRSKNISEYEINWDDIKYVSPEFHKKLKKSSLSSGDVAIVRTGKPGTCCVIPENIKEANCSDIVIVRVDKAKLCPHYLSFFMNSMANHQVSSRLVGAVQQHFNVSAAKQIEIPLPSLDEQNEIAHVLKTISDKIFVNTETNQTLEEMAQAIFKSWFVDFDPVKAKMNGERPEGMDAATASLFPEKLVDSELGLIPDGWEIHKTQDLFDVKDGTHDSPKKTEEGHYLVTSKHITKGKIDTSSAYLISDADFEKVNQRSKVDTFDILLTMIGTVGEVVVVYDNPVEFAIKNVGLFKTSQRPELVWLFYWHLQSFKMKHYLEVRMAGTTQQYLTLKTLRTIPVVLPSEELLSKFNNVMSPLMEKISDNHKQTQTLSNLRDTLLPKLLSGEIELETATEN
ncbi:restriction endonuclease subunit S [Vibrio europaeus]|uniref:restriction endonuclease subunit S n=1 Tax=Vibrio oreintalis group TaxID=1891919 RepID=UPI0018A77A8D|nr:MULTISPECIES: restriction endonuclease subunit S [Vibrio oreintalis group]MCG9579643.1 restriction endonuclease subunit S [Vibrio tubiashii]MDC5808232.1 restriction endonuclease subunit S [Vibrio europaeus]QPG37943.1 restriction endonuclease subunit S [Vibrio europaeus]